MADQPKDSGVSISSFFARRKLPPSAREECDVFVRRAFPNEQIRPAPFQGYCSYTVFVGWDKVVQFRPPDHSLDVTIFSAACAIFGDLAPETEFLGMMDEGSGLHVYSMRRLAGSSLSELRASTTPAYAKALRRRIVVDFARFQATSWKRARPKGKVLEKRTVGSSLQWRLNLIESGIPSRFQSIVSLLQRQLPDIEALPWALSHGDFIPANILVRPESGEMSGLLDWAEAEFLPFGVGMYGLEELLGEDIDGRFSYYPEAKQLRKLFWSELLTMIHELARDAQILRTVKAAQTLGILLWHAIAFDDGKLNRAVEAGVDDGEIQRLDMFLLDHSGQCTRQTVCQRCWASLLHLQGLMLGNT